MTTERVPCLQLEDGSLIPLKPFDQEAAERAAQAEPGKPLFLSVSALEGLGETVVLALVPVTRPPEDPGGFLPLAERITLAMGSAPSLIPGTWRAPF